MCVYCLTPGVRPDPMEPARESRFEEVQRRAKATGMVVGVYLVKANQLQHHALCDEDVCFSECQQSSTFRLNLKGDIDANLDSQLDDIEEELAYWEGR